MKSKIFTKTEMAELERRLEGKKENYRIWYRAKPKIIEMIDKWMPIKEDLEELVRGKK